MTSYVQANTNGHLHPAEEPSLSPLNRGFLYGDSIYEVWRTYERVIFAWEEHWSRLEASARALFLTLPGSAADMLSEMKRTVAAFRQRAPEAQEVYIRLQVTRGSGPLGLDIALAARPDFVILVQENRLFSEEKLAAGLALSFSKLRRNPPEALNPAWKTGNYLNNILCLREARARGADEVVITNLAGEIAEAAVSNIAFVRKGVVVTPPLKAGILAGITRRLLIERVGPAASVEIAEETLRPADLADMQECFLLSSTKDITPVASIDQFQFARGAATVTMRLKLAFISYTKSYAQEHPGHRV